MKNQFGLDHHYFNEKLSQLVRDVEHYTPQEMARALARLSIVADQSIVREAEFHCVTKPEQREGRIYIAGPMTGYEDHNFPAFHAKAKELRDAEFVVENPADHGVVDWAEWGDYLRYDISRLLLCDSVYFLKGWQNSKGANFEWRVAKTLGLTMMFEQPYYDTPIDEGLAEDVIQNLMEYIGPLPESKCACHIAPPCYDCTEYGAIRETYEFAEEILQKRGL